MLMYEIWLMLNIAWEIALGVWPVLVLSAMAWLVLTGIAVRRAPHRWGRAAAVAVGAGAIATLIAFLALPALTRSSLSELSYWVDWASLAGLALGAGAVVALFALPIAVLQGGSTASTRLTLSSSTQGVKS
jgi:hypothetical protein